MRKRNRIAVSMSAAACMLIPSQMAATTASPPVMLYQGKDWTPARRLDFYSRDQGSRIMPLAWFRSLNRADGTAFLPAGLRRYGYLDNPSAVDDLPVGFTVDSGAAGRSIGMTCAACHTRELQVENVRYRIDGGPAVVDFQHFLTDMDDAVGRILADQAAFSDFAAKVGAFSGSPVDRATLHAEVAAWYLRYHTLMVRALPQDGWGLGRLDAVSMIFNRLTGLDLGPPPTFMIPGNIARADAPVRYPFVWDAPRQDHTQWPGFAANGDELLGFARNLGEVYGVFGVFFPHRSQQSILGFDFRTDNSANFPSLRKLEGLVRNVGAPAWPWAIDPTMRARGQTVFNWSAQAGGCKECHGEQRGATRLVPFSLTWKTHQMDVGTDTREYQVMDRMAQSGAIDGALKPNLGRLKPVDRSIDILATSVVGAILQDLVGFHGTSITEQAAASVASKATKTELSQAFVWPTNTPARSYKYEARVLHGVWATAPYLHNGSVPTLWDLLTPSAQRVAEFDVGSAFDRNAVGLAKAQPGLRQHRVTTGCDRLDSGNSRCGHDYGTQLSDADKRALIEFLKTY